MTNSEIAAIILPWAKAQHPEKYADTLKVAANERTFRRYMIRLIEIRWTEDTDRTWRNEISLAVLEESAVTMNVIHKPTGTPLTFSGRLSGGSRKWTWAEMAMLMEQPDPSAAIGQLVMVKRTLDLESAE
jgi:hypothetical protein